MSTQDRPPPSLLATAIASALIAGIIGYFVGQGSSLGLFGTPPATTKAHAAADSKESESESDESEEEEGQEGLEEFSDKTEECKLVLVVRTDLGMTKGKLENEKVMI